MKHKTILFFICLVLIGLVFYMLQSSKKLTVATIKVNDIEIMVELARSLQQQALGLGLRDSLASNHGMLFIYDDYKMRNFWMKDVSFPIDVLWIKDSQILGLQQNIQPSSNGLVTRFKSPQAVNYVLELKAGFIDEYSIKTGDLVEINL